MFQLACLLDGGLCVLAVCGGGFVLSALGITLGKKKTKHPHKDCQDCHHEQTEQRP